MADEHPGIIHCESCGLISETGHMEEKTYILFRKPFGKVLCTTCVVAYRQFEYLKRKPATVDMDY